MHVVRLLPHPIVKQLRAPILQQHSQRSSSVNAQISDLRSSCQHNHTIYKWMDFPKIVGEILFQDNALVRKEGAVTSS
jgi:hypothetical protein